MSMTAAMTQLWGGWVGVTLLLDRAPTLRCLTTGRGTLPQVSGERQRVLSRRLAAAMTAGPLLSARKPRLQGSGCGMPTRVSGGGMEPRRRACGEAVTPAPRTPRRWGLVIPACRAVVLTTSTVLSRRRFTTATLRLELLPRTRTGEPSPRLESPSRRDRFAAASRCLHPRRRRPPAIVQLTFATTRG
jgi:hypothetical protein